MVNSLHFGFIVIFVKWKDFMSKSIYEVKNSKKPGN